MKTHTKKTLSVAPHNGFFFSFLLLGLLLAISGCATIDDLMKEEIEPEVVVQTAEYGTVTQITPALMHDREIRRGDIAITVDTDNDRIIVVTQPEDDVYKVGDRVRIVRDNKGFIRVQLAL